MEFKKKYGEWGVILGATEGVGKALAEKIACLGMNVVLVGRREQQLQELGATLAAKHGIATKVVRADFAEPACTDGIFAATADLDVGFMSYVACLSVFGRFEKALWEEHEKMLNINVVTFTKCTYHYYKIFRKQGRGLLLNISSNAGVTGAPCIGQYGAGKAFNTNLTRTLYYESLDSENVDVAVAILAATTTPNFLATLPEGAIGEMVLASAMSPEDSIEQVFAHLDLAPVIIVGDANRESLTPHIHITPKEQALAAMQMYDR